MGSSAPAKNETQIQNTERIGREGRQGHQFRNGREFAAWLGLGHTKMDSTVRYLGVELEDALAIAEAIEI